MKNYLLFGIVVMVFSALASMANAQRTPLPSGTSGTNATHGSAEGAIVYTRIKRTTEPFEASKGGETAYVSNPSVFDRLPEIGWLRENFNGPGQLVIRTADGTERIIYDCVTDNLPCVPSDAMPSLDGSKIAFSVYHAKRLKVGGRVEGWEVQNITMDEPSHAQIFIYDIESGTLSAWPYEVGVYDISPVWLANGKILFSSDRDKTYGSQLTAYRPRKGKYTFNLFEADDDGSNAVNKTPHEVNGAIHPYVTSSGRVVYSSFWLSHNLAFHSGAILSGTTLNNQWTLMAADQGMGKVSALLGGHRNKFLKESQYLGSKFASLRALHFAAERTNGDVCTANYYRRNNLGTGDILCWPLQPVDFEGPSPSFTPEGLYSAALWATHIDNPGPEYEDQKGVYMGKVGWPEGLPGGDLMLSWARGRCSNARIRDASVLLYFQNDPGCDVGIYKTTVIPSAHPSDLELIVDRPEWHEIAARHIGPRTIPPVPEYTGDTCTISISSAFDSDAHRSGQYQFNSKANAKAAANHGTEIDGLPTAEVKSIRFYRVLENTEQPPHPRFATNMRNHVGHMLDYMGDAPVYGDGSVWTEIPCNTPYVLGGADKDGFLVKRDQYPQLLQTGEDRQCAGCHLHGETGKPFEGTMASATSPASLVRLFEEIPTFEDDVKPLFLEKCQDCHDTNSDAFLYDYSGLVYDALQSMASNPVLVGSKQTKILRKPNTSKYVNNVFARESLLFWKAANVRTDGRTDDTYTDDIDFGADHPTDLTEDEVTMIGFWLDSGAPRGGVISNTGSKPSPPVNLRVR